MHGCLGLLAIFLLPFSRCPTAHPGPFLALSAALHWGYYYFLVSGYQHGDLGVVYPLARGSAPLMVATFGALIAGEYFSPAAVAGLVLASVGIISLSFENGVPGRNRLRAVFLDWAQRSGSRLIHSPMALVYASQAISSAISCGCLPWKRSPSARFALWIRRTSWRGYYSQNWRGLWLSGLVSGAAYGIVIYAMGTHPMALVSALRETSVVFAVLIGVFILKEKNLLFRTGAAITVAVGLAVMNLAN